MASPKARAETPTSSRYRLDEQVGFILRRAQQRHLSIFGDLIPDLTPTQFAALAKLCEIGPVSQNELGRQTAMDAATIKGVVDRLRKRGYVTNRRDENDQRRIFLEPTSAGRAAYERCEMAAHRVSEATLEPLSPHERIRFLHLLKKLT